MSPRRSSPPRILLIGMMGSGKSTVGRVLAQRLGWSYLDSDDEITRRTGKGVPEIWRSEGEPAFRAQEAAVLADAVVSTGPAVVAVAGGAVLDPLNRRRIAGAGVVVWLRASTATLAERVGDGSGRPLLDGDTATAVAALDLARRPVYESLADVTVDVDSLTPDEIADAVVSDPVVAGAVAPDTSTPAAVMRRD